MTQGGDYYSKEPPHPCERLARQEGQSNFLSLLAGIEAGPDTTEDAAALAMCRSHGTDPEALETRWNGTIRHKVKLCHMVYDTLTVAEKDRTWTKAAILDGFAMFAGLPHEDYRARARLFKVDNGLYLATRKYAERLLLNVAVNSERHWIRARFGSR